MNVNVRLGEDRVVEASLGSFTIRTDQPASSGGAGTAPSPFDLFLASIATCAGFYVLEFCRLRDLPTEGITVEMRPCRNLHSKMIDNVEIEIMLPEDFPAKYEKAVIRAAELCAVKKHLEAGIQFHTSATRVCA